ncbi:MAG: polysaccharide deacetylase family protein [Anaerolineales bacterium]
MQTSLTPSAVEYARLQLMRRAGAPQDLVPFFYGDPSEARFFSPGVIVCPCAPQAWNQILHAPPHSLAWLPLSSALPAGGSAFFQNDLPVLFWGQGFENVKPFVEQRQDGSLVFYADIFSAAVFMLSRWEESASPARDAHDRFPAHASVAYQQGFLDLPVIDQYAFVLREWLKKIAPHWQPAALQPALNLTHDIDWTMRFPNPVRFLRMAGGELIKKNLQGFLRQVQNLYVQTFRPAQDEYLQSIYALADISEANGARSRFFFMAAQRGKYQQGYSCAAPLTRRCMLDLLERGHQIGIHPGYETYQNPQKLMEEKRRLEDALGVRVDGGRQHFLRFAAPFTWRHWRQAGLSYDSTLGYADCEGFRCGTCHPYQPFDVEADQVIPVEEIPLIAMDATLRLYRRLSAEEGRLQILELARRCFAVGGAFTLLWHNTSLVDEWAEWAAAYPRIVRELADMRRAFLRP